MSIKSLQVQALVEEKNLQVNQANYEQYKDIERVNGHLTVLAANAVFSKLKFVEGDLLISARKVSMPMLEVVTERMNISSMSTGFRAPNLVYVAQVYIRARDVEFPKVKEVPRGLFIAGMNASFPELTEVGNGLYVSATGAQLPELTTVYKILKVTVAGLKLPKLEKIKGVYQCRSDGEPEMPHLKSYQSKENI